MNAQVTKTCKAGFFYLHNICRTRKFLTQEITEKLIHAFVTSHLDHCNSLLYGLPSNLLAKLQWVQNAAARLINLAPRFCHITPLLVGLHWLDIKSRIDFKIILLTYKAIHGRAAPAYICELVNLKLNSSYGLRSNNKMLLSTLNFRTLPALGALLLQRPPNYGMLFHCQLDRSKTLSISKKSWRHIYFYATTRVFYGSHFNRF